MASAAPVIEDPADPPADPPAANDPPADPPSDPPADPPADDDWRTRFAGTDEKALAWLGRYPSEGDFLKDAKRRYDDVRGGKFLKPLGDDPSESEIATHREAMGVPDKPEGYLEKLSGGLVVGEADRPVVDQFLTAMHEKHVPAAITDAVLQAYYKIVEGQDAGINERVTEATRKCEDELREEWGGDYRRNLNATTGFIETLPVDVQAAINEGFGPDGIPLASNVAVKKWLAGLALDANPLATVVPGAGTNQASAIADELAELEKMMGNTQSEYWKGPKAAQLQERYRVLVDAKAKLPK